MGAEGSAGCDLETWEDNGVNYHPQVGERVEEAQAKQTRRGAGVRRDTERDYAGESGKDDTGGSGEREKDEEGTQGQKEPPRKVTAWKPRFGYELPVLHYRPRV